MEVCVLASGSKGNSVYIAGGGAAVLVDVGVCAREMSARLQAAKIDPSTLDAVLFTHDHVDHYRGADLFSRRYPVRLFANEGTATGIECCFTKRAFQWEIFETASGFDIKGLHIEAFTVSHDAADPVGFCFDDGTSRLCLITDLGQTSPLIHEKISKCDVAILESNHDVDMLMASERSWSLKTRIAGRSGHLSNDSAATLMSTAISSKLHTLLLAHLSDECNTPDLALNTMRRALDKVGRADVRIEVMSQKQVSGHYIF